MHDDVRGLQVLEPACPSLGRCADTDDGDVWIDVPRVAPYQVVVQIGQLTQRWTNDEYRATPHRVLKPSAPAPARTTLSCFFRPGIDTVLEVPASLRRPNGEDKYICVVVVSYSRTVPSSFSRFSIHPMRAHDESYIVD